jgi:outer membrane protein
MKTIITILISIVSASIILVFGLWYQSEHKPKFGYIVLGEVFEKFDLKNELASKLKLTQAARQKRVDSLETRLRLLSKKIEDDKGKNKEDIRLFEIQRDGYIKWKRQNDDDNDLQTKQYDKQIRSQMSQYVIEFGKVNGYRYIFGSDGNGSLMYGVDADNLTKEVTEFINKKYKGVN